MRKNEIEKLKYELAELKEYKKNVEYCLNYVNEENRKIISDLEQENEQIKEQLAEKDKEIEELKEFYDNMLRNKLEVKCVSATEEKIKEIRKQVCDEFKKAIITESIFDTEEEARYWTDDIDVKTILEIIDKIEQAKENKL